MISSRLKITKAIIDTIKTIDKKSDSGNHHHDQLTVLDTFNTMNVKTYTIAKNIN